jgi:hypothetical protein
MSKELQTRTLVKFDQFVGRHARGANLQTRKTASRTVQVHRRRWVWPHGEAQQVGVLESDGQAIVGHPHDKVHILDNTGTLLHRYRLAKPPNGRGIRTLEPDHVAVLLDRTFDQERRQWEILYMEPEEVSFIIGQSQPKKQ